MGKTSGKSESLGFCGSSRHWLALVNRRTASYVEVFPPRINDFPRKPVTVLKKIHWQFLIYNRFISPPGYVLSIKNGTVYPADNAVITDDGFLLGDFLDMARPINSWISYLKGESRPEATLNKNIAVLLSPRNDYFHWITETLPRIYLLIKSKQWRDVDLFLLNNYVHRYQRESLAIFGIGEDRIVTADQYKSIKARRLIVPSSWLEMPKWACLAVRNILLRCNNAAVACGLFNKIYISREDAHWRKLGNEGEVWGLLKGCGFQKIVLKNMPLQDQVNIFSCADAVIAPHGAGLSNIIFCRKKAKIIEFFPPHYIMPMYWKISNYLGLDYGYIIGEGRQYPESYDRSIAFTDRSNKENIKLPIPKLKKTLALFDL